MKKKIKCNSCNAEFDSLFDDEKYKDFICTQADNCAGEVQFNLNEIGCDYGSRYDFNVYEFVKGEVPDWIEKGVICDVCIKKLINDGQIRLKRIKHI